MTTAEHAQRGPTARDNREGVQISRLGRGPRPTRTAAPWRARRERLHVRARQGAEVAHQSTQGRRCEFTTRDPQKNVAASREDDRNVGTLPDGGGGGV